MNLTFKTLITYCVLSLFFVVSLPNTQAQDIKPDDNNQDRRNPAEIPYIGLIGAPLISNIAESLGLKKGQGFYIIHLAPDSPAAKAGMHSYSALRSIDGKHIHTQQDLKKVIRSYKVGDKVKVDYFIKGKQLTREIELRAMPDDIMIAHQKLDDDDPNNNILTRFAGTPQAINLGSLPFSKSELEGLSPEMVERLKKADRESQEYFKNHVPTKKEIERDRKIEENRTQQSRSISQIDPKTSHKYSIYKFDGKEELNIHDAKGELLYSSPLDTAADISATPEQYMDQLMNLLDTIRMIPFS